ncbi:hypothetical protein BKA66DRAFT_456308 [Pyrenochaeta sp. MPI-SDFR-AT-0127]|nr:hypothetical protein BKA66DRAFT_456308 [Pyrenochaeta sp. MPI-SDFR-AT-0127]
MAGSIKPEAKKPVERSKTDNSPDKKDRATRTTIKRLPWLDGKASRAVSTIPHDGRKSDIQTSSPATPLSSRKTITAAIPKRVATSTPTVRMKIKAPPGEPQVIAVAGSSPAPVTRHRLPQSQRRSLIPKAMTPLSVSNRAFASREQRKRPSIVQYDDDELEDSPIYETRPLADSLAPVPNHLERSKTLDSTRVLKSRNMRSVESPAFVTRVQMSPRHPAADRSAFKQIGDRRVSNAVEELEGMVQEAVEMTDCVDSQGKVTEIYNIIKEARNAVQEATVDHVTRLMATASPLEASSGDRENMSEYSPQSVNGQYQAKTTLHQPRRSPPPLPVVPQPNLLNGSVPVLDANLQKHPASVDWVYSNRNDHGYLASSPSLSDHEEGWSRSKFSTQSDLLLSPQPAQTTPRDHVDFVLRPQAREEPYDHSRRRLTGKSAIHVPRQRTKPKHRQHLSSHSSQIGTSFDEEDDPIEAYGNKLSVREQAHHHTFSLRRSHRRQPVARDWSTGKKRLTAVIACINTALLGITIGVYAGEVPRIQYFLADESHIVVIGNAVLYFSLAITTFLVWPLPLLHGRKPYVLAALALALPLQFPQAIVVSTKRSPNTAKFRAGLLCSRAALGLILGFANVNYITVLLDLFGASLQSKNPHQEFVVANDIRRHGGGMGIWLGIWSWCWIGSLAVGFQIGAAIIESLTPDWGFYIVVIILAAALVLNILAPETRRAPYRKSITEVYDRDENYITRRVSRGEVKLHVSTEGPKYWFEEVWAGMKLMVMMLCQPGFLVLSLYLGWIYAEIVLVIVLLGALLSKDYKWQPRFVGAGVMSIALGAFIAIPLTKAGLFSRERKRAFRTDSMTFQKQVTWSSHLVRRAIFTLTLPLMGLAYTVSAAGVPKPYIVPIVFAGAVGFLSILAIAECHGLIMETFDTCDLQPGVNTRHRLESMAVQDRRRRTNYSSFPRITAGIFASQTLAFIGAGVATMVGGSMTRRLGAQASTGVTAGILFGLTILLIAVLWRFKEVQVIPNYTFGTRRDTAAWDDFKHLEKIGRGADWKAVVIGNPSGKMRKMSVLELGSLSRWTEIRKLNFLLKGPRLGEEKQKRRNFRDSL